RSAAQLANSARRAPSVGVFVSAVSALLQVALVPFQRRRQPTLHLVHLADVEERPRMRSQRVGTLVLLERPGEVALILQPISRIEVTSGIAGSILRDTPSLRARELWPEKPRRAAKGDTDWAASHAPAPLTATLWGSPCGQNLQDLPWPSDALQRDRMIAAALPA